MLNSIIRREFTDKKENVVIERYVVKGQCQLQIHRVVNGALKSVHDLDEDEIDRIEWSIRPRCAVWDFFHKRGVMDRGLFVQSNKWWERLAHDVVEFEAQKT